MDGVDVHWMLEQEKTKTTPPPSSMGEYATDMDKEIFKVEVSDYVKCCNRMQDNLEKSYTLILGQCTALTHTQI